MTRASIKRFLAWLSVTLALIAGAVGTGSAADPAAEPAAPAAGAPAATESGAADTATLDALVSSIRSNRKALVAVNLGLTDVEAAAFWPAYDRYAGEIAAVGDRLTKIIGEYSAAFPDLSDDEAMKLIEDYLAVEADRVAVKRSYLAEFAKLLPGRKVARLYQIENKMDAVIRYDLAAAIPVVEGKSSPAPE
jgi:hypothetical protein